MKPMLASPAPALPKFPVYASPKLDGIRAMIRGGIVLSRSLKPIPNKHIQRTLGYPTLEGLDGELIVGKPYAPDAMNVTSSGVMSREGLPKFTYHVFDRWNEPDMPYRGRFNLLGHELPILAKGFTRPIVLVPQVVIQDFAQLRKYEEEQLEMGYEGLIIRGMDSPYKYGRSTAKEGYLLKIKRFLDSEMIVTGYEPKLHNANEQTRDERGYAKRSSHKENMVTLDTLGNILGKDIHTGKEISVGSGLTDEMRKHIWENRPRYMGALVTYKYFPLGVKDKPRFSVFKAFRDKADMS